MEKAADLSGYLFESNIRFASKCAPWFGFPIIGLFGVLLWVETIKCFFSLPLLLLAFLWSCLCVWLVWSYNYTRKIDSIKYSCIQNKVINQLQDGKRTVYLDNTVFAALLKAEFAYGKSTQNKEFYIISRSIDNAEKCRVTSIFENYFNDHYIETIQKVRDAVHRENLPVNILPGMEAFGTPDLPDLLENGQIMTINQSRYLLIEFAFDEEPELVEYIVDKVHHMKIIPVIAHAERYKFVQRNPNRVYRWRKKGYPIQINKGSFQGRFGRAAAETAHLLLEHNLVSVVASDAHSPHIRTPYMANVYEELLMHYPENYIDMLFKENPRRICQNEPILGYTAKRVE